MFNFGAGGGAMIFQRGLERNLRARIRHQDRRQSGRYRDHDSAAEGDEIALLPPEMGTLHGRLDVHNAEYMAERLGAVSLTRFVRGDHRSHRAQRL